MKNARRAPIGVFEARRLLVAVAFGIFFPGLLALGAQDLGIAPSDTRIEGSPEGGYLLYIRKKPDIQSVLLTESTADPNFKNASYGLRDPVYHKENGDEKRKLDGKFLDTTNLHSLIDSTPIVDAQFGQAYRIFIPFVVVFGYPNTRYGETQVTNGTYLNIRTFSKPYGDYEDGGLYHDNPFTFQFVQVALTPRPSPSATPSPTPSATPSLKPPVSKAPATATPAPSPSPVPTPDLSRYMPDTVRTFGDRASETKGTLVPAKDENDIVPHIRALIAALPKTQIDVVLCIDNTKSMENDLPVLKKTLVPALKEMLSPFKRFRVGIVQFRDYFEEFMYQEFPFTDDFEVVQKTIDRMRALGGGDIPEAVDEALYASIKDFAWLSDNRLVILLGDAPPHPIPRGTITPDQIYKLSREKNVKIDAIMLPME